MECNSHCPLGIAMLAIPVLRVVETQMQQSIAAQLPWWLWLIIVLLALIAIFWWQVYLRPSQANEVQEMEHHLGHDQENRISAEVDSHRIHAETIEPTHENSTQLLDTNEHAPNGDPEPPNSGNEIAPEE